MIEVLVLKEETVIEIAYRTRQSVRHLLDRLADANARNLVHSYAIQTVNKRTSWACIPTKRGD